MRLDRCILVKEEYDEALEDAFTHFIRRLAFITGCVNSGNSEEVGLPNL